VLSKLCDAVVPQFPWKRIIVRVWRPAMRLNSPAIKWPEKNQAPNKQILRTAADRSCQSNRNAMQSYVRLYVLLYTLTIIEYNLHVYNIYISYTCQYTLTYMSNILWSCTEQLSQTRPVLKALSVEW
jgi:hypothetical protein